MFRLKKCGIAAIVIIASLMLAACSDNQSGSGQDQTAQAPVNPLKKAIHILVNEPQRNICFATFNDVYLMVYADHIDVYEPDKGLIMRRGVGKAPTCDKDTILASDQLPIDQKFGLRLFDDEIKVQLAAQAGPGMWATFTKALHAYEPLTESTTRVADLPPKLSLKKMASTMANAPLDKTSHTRGKSKSLKRKDVQERLNARLHKHDHVCTVNNQLGHVMDVQGDQVRVQLEGMVINQPKGYLFEKKSGQFVVFRTYDILWLTSHEVAECTVHK